MACTTCAGAGAVIAAAAAEGLGWQSQETTSLAAFVGHHNSVTTTPFQVAAPGKARTYRVHRRALR